MKIPKDIVLQASGDGKWTIYNVFTQNWLGISNDSLNVLSEIDSGKTIEGVSQQNKHREYSVWEIEQFSNFDGLLADPTRLIRDPLKWGDAKKVNITELIGIFKKKFFIIENEEEYLSIFGLKESILDSKHLGNFHQQLGQKLLLEKKVNPEQWWIAQKFSPQFESVNNNLYRAIEEYFLDKFFKKTLNESHHVLDLGCGIGYFSNIMSKTGAKITAIDPNIEYIEIAKEKFGKNVVFKNSEIGKHDSLDWLEPNSFDFVFMTDALLFYFVSPNPKVKLEIGDLFHSIKRILKPGGRFFSLEPHGIFFLRPWLGDSSRPFTIITEYKNKIFNITPNMSELLQSFISGGFIVRNVIELGIDEKFSKYDLRATNFAKEFPLWWFFELEPEK